MYCICQQVYCICHHVHQQPHLGVLHLPTGVLHLPSFNIRSNTGVYYISHQCTAEDMMYLRSFTSVTWVYCISYHVHQEPSPGCTAFANRYTAFAIKCTTEAIMHIRSLTSVLEEPQLGVLHLPTSGRGHDVLQEPQFSHLGILHLPSSVLHILSCESGASLGVLYLPAGVLHLPSCTSGASLGCTVFANRCTAFAII